MELYRWQKACLQAWIDNQGRGIVDVATGAGKTTLALAISKYILDKYPDTHIRVIVPTKKLASQWKKDIILFFHCEENINSFVQAYSSNNRRKDSVFTIYIINTARTCISGHIVSDIKKGIHTLMIVDECHRAASPSNQNIFYFKETEFYNQDLCFFLGLSATPDRPDYPDVLTNALGKIIYHYGTKDAENDQIVTPFQIISTSVKLTGKEMDEYGRLCFSMNRLYKQMLKECPKLKALSDAAFFKTLNQLAIEDEESYAYLYLKLLRKRRSLLYTAENRLHVIHEIIKHSHHQKCIIFSERIDQCETIYQRLLKHYPNKVAHYHSEMDSDARKRNMDLFTLGECWILVTCKALDEGLNVPDVCIGIIASSSSVERQHIQRLGRILRRSQNKVLSVLYYIYTEDTVENPIFLSDSSIVYQKYLNSSQGFICKEYENAALSLKEEIKYEPKEDQMTFERAIEEASGSADWLYPVDTYNNLILHSASMYEEDYWRIMKRLSDIHRKQLQE